MHTCGFELPDVRGGRERQEDAPRSDDHIDIDEDADQAFREGKVDEDDTLSSAAQVDRRLQLQVTKLAQKLKHVHLIVTARR